MRDRMDIRNLLLNAQLFFIPIFLSLFTRIELSFNSLLPSAHKSARIAKILILKLEGTNKTISYERRDCESVGEKSLS